MCLSSHFQYPGHPIYFCIDAREPAAKPHRSCCKQASSSAAPPAALPSLDYIRRGYSMRRMSKSRPTGPLTPAVFHILLALHGRERHGYDIMQQVKDDSQGAVKMGPGTLYGSLDRMIAAGLVVRSNTRDERRIYYKLTAFGQAALSAESARLSAIAAIARRQLKAT